MAAPIPFIRGCNAVLKLYQQNKPIHVSCKVWDLEENATEVADSVGGEDRDHLDKVTNYYSGTLEIFQSDQAVLDAYMDSQAADDAAGLPLEQMGGLLLKNRNGTRAAYTLQEMKVGPMKVSMGSRQDAVMLQLKVRWRYMKKVPSI